LFVLLFLNNHFRFYMFQLSFDFFKVLTVILLHFFAFF